MTSEAKHLLAVVREARSFAADYDYEEAARSIAAAQDWAEDVFGRRLRCDDRGRYYLPCAACRKRGAYCNPKFQEC